MRVVVLEFSYNSLSPRDNCCAPDVDVVDFCVTTVVTELVDDDAVVGIGAIPLLRTCCDDDDDFDLACVVCISGISCTVINMSDNKSSNSRCLSSVQ